MAIVSAGRGVKRHQPDGGDTQPMQIVEAPREALEVTDTVAVGSM